MHFPASRFGLDDMFGETHHQGFGFAYYDSSVGRGFWDVLGFLAISTCPGTAKYDSEKR